MRIVRSRPLVMAWVFGLGLSFTFVDMREVSAVERAVTPATRMIYCETPTNPMMNLVDLAAVGDIAQAHGYLFVVDNTFATPCFQRPLEFGADLVLHSTTKYLNGHSDMVGGMLVTSRDDLAERLAFLQNAAGGVPGPMDCWLALRGVKTLPLRMRQHDANGRRIAEWLSHQRGIAKVYYPGLPSHPQHALARRLMPRHSGAMLSFDLRGGAPAVERFMARARLLEFAPSFGDVATTWTYPARTSHRRVSDEAKAAMGIGPGLVRVSVGLEDPAELQADLEAALA